MDDALSAKLSLMLGCEILCENGFLLKVRSARHIKLNLSELGIRGIFPGCDIDLLGHVPNITLLLDDANVLEVSHVVMNRNLAVNLDITNVKSLNLCQKVCKYGSDIEFALDAGTEAEWILSDADLGRAKYLYLVMNCNIWIGDVFEEFKVFDPCWDEKFVKKCGSSLISYVDKLHVEDIFVHDIARSVLNVWRKRLQDFDWTSPCSYRYALELLQGYKILNSRGLSRFVRYFVNVNGRNSDMEACMIRLIDRLRRE